MAALRGIARAATPALRAIAPALLLACAAPKVASHRADLRAARPGEPAAARLVPLAQDPSAVEQDRGAPVALPGTVADYQRRAASANPEVRAAWARWHSGVEQVAVAGRLPEPVVSFSHMASAIETRVGPQRARFGVAQDLPWPSAVRAGVGAASERATAEELAFDAVVHRVAARATDAYWALWLIRRQRTLLTERVDIERGALEAARRRVALGQAPLAALTRREIGALRLADRAAALDEEERSAQAELRAIAGLPPDAPTPTTEDPAPARLPPADTAALSAHAESHPRVEALDARAEASLLEARQRAAERLPSIGVSADWIDVGPAPMPGVPDSGKDVLMFGVAVRLPIATRSLKAAVDASRADAAMYRAEADAAALQAEAELQAALSRVRDTARRDALVRGELIPRTEAAISSLAGAQTDEAAAALIDARADLVDLRIEAASITADHERAWAWLTWIVGHPVGSAAPVQSPGE
jgi:outer membrane protein, heavy metal efflux system